MRGMNFLFLPLFLFCYNPDGTNRQIIFGRSLTLLQIPDSGRIRGDKNGRKFETFPPDLPEEIQVQLRPSS